MENLTKSQQATIMHRARLHHKRGISITNVELAKDMGLSDDKQERERICMDLGLHPWGNNTDLHRMTSYINKNK